MFHVLFNVVNTMSDRQGRSRMSLPSYYKMTISLYARESGRKPHWQGASNGKRENKFCIFGDLCKFYAN